MTNFIEVIKLSQMQINRICDFYLNIISIVVKSEDLTSEDWYMIMKTEGNMIQLRLKNTDSIHSKKRVLMTLLLTLILVLSGCQVNGSQNETDNNGITGEGDALENNKGGSTQLNIVTTLFPQYDFTKEIGGDAVNVTLIIPPGVEPHAFEPTPQDVLKMLDADVLIYTSAEMEPWITSVLETLDPTKTLVVDASAGVEMIASDHDHEEAADHEEDADDADDEHDGIDPHYWLDPNNAIIMVSNILSALSDKLPEKATLFSENASKLTNDLEALDQTIVDAVERFDSKTILSGGHFAFGYFAHRYGLENVSPYEGFSPDAEPTPQKIAQLIDTISSTKAKAIYYEELIDPRVAKVISDETGVEMLLLHAAHNISKEELSNGTTYLEIMYGNLERLKEGLGYK